MDNYNLRLDRNEIACCIEGLQRLIEADTGNEMAQEREMFSRSALDKAEALLKVAEADEALRDARWAYNNVVKYGKAYNDLPFA